MGRRRQDLKYRQLWVLEMENNLFQIKNKNTTKSALTGNTNTRETKRETRRAGEHR